MDGAGVDEGLFVAEGVGVGVGDFEALGVGVGVTDGLVIGADGGAAGDETIAVPTTSMVTSSD